MLKAQILKKIESDFIYATRDEQGRLIHIKEPKIGKEYIKIGVVAGG